MQIEIGVRETVTLLLEQDSPEPGWQVLEAEGSAEGRVQWGLEAIHASHTSQDSL